jgi:hypothetical protein
MCWLMTKELDEYQVLNGVNSNCSGSLLLQEPPVGNMRCVGARMVALLQRRASQLKLRFYNVLQW